MPPQEGRDTKPSLHFSSAEHSVLGMNGSAMDTLRDNAPAVVGAFRLVSILMASVAHPLTLMHGFFVLGSEVILLLYGNRNDIEKHKKTQKNTPSPGPIGKVFEPHKYPIESSAAFDVMGEIPHFILGAGMILGWEMGGVASFIGESLPTTCPPGTEAVPHGNHFHCNPIEGVAAMPQIGDPDYAEKLNKWLEAQQSGTATPINASGHNHLTGMALMIHGALGVLGHLPLWLLGPEKNKSSPAAIDLVGDDLMPTKPTQTKLEFAQSTSTVVGSLGGDVKQWFTDNQVMISSVLQAAMAVSMFMATGMPVIYQLAGIPLLAGAVLQGALVSKADFSAEAKKEEKPESASKNTSQNLVHSAAYTGKVKAHDPKQFQNGLPA